MNLIPYILVYEEGKLQSVSSFPQFCSAPESSNEDRWIVLQTLLKTFSGAEGTQMEQNHGSTDLISNLLLCFQASHLWKQNALAF